MGETVSGDWLPALLQFSDCGGDWHRYLEAQYGQFCRDFIDSTPTCFHPKRWAMKRHPLSCGKEATFWHVTSEGKTEEDRVPDFRRCERIGWIRPMIEARGSDRVRCWKAVRHGEDRPIVALPDFSFLVVLTEREEYVMLWTAFYVPGERRREKYRKEWEACPQKC